MNLPEIFNYHITYQDRIMKMNQKIQKYGYTLTKKDIEIIVKERERSLIHTGRVELDIQVTEMIIEELSQSPYVDRESFIDSIILMQEVFYYIKTETDDRLTDEDLLNILFEYFDMYAGNIELLSGKVADELIRQFNL